VIYTGRVNSNQTNVELVL